MRCNVPWQRSHVCQQGVWRVKRIWGRDTRTHWAIHWAAYRSRPSTALISRLSRLLLHPFTGDSHLKDPAMSQHALIAKQGQSITFLEVMQSSVTKVCTEKFNLCLSLVAVYCIAVGRCRWVQTVPSTGSWGHCFFFFSSFLSLVSAFFKPSISNQTCTNSIVSSGRLDKITHYAFGNHERSSPFTSHQGKKLQVQYGLLYLISSPSSADKHCEPHWKLFRCQSFASHDTLCFS